MSTKPSTIPLWDTTQTNIVNPTAGQVSNGWATGDQPTSGNFNYLKYWAGQWCQYLSDGAFSGASSFDSTLAVAGLLSANGGVTSTGSITGGSLHFTTAREREIPALLSTDNLGGAPGAHHTRTAYGWTLAANGNAIYYPIVLPVGAVLTSYSIDLVKNDTTNAVFSRLVYETVGTENFASTGVSSGTTAGSQLLDESGLSVTITSGRAYYLRILPGGTATPAADAFGNVRITWTE